MIDGIEAQIVGERSSLGGNEEAERRKLGRSSSGVKTSFELHRLPRLTKLPLIG